jgi:hypothetical protein
MREMGWSFAELEATPAYVVRYCSDLMRIRRAAEADAQEEANRKAERER